MSLKKRVTIAAAQRKKCAGTHISIWFSVFRWAVWHPQRTTSLSLFTRRYLSLKMWFKAIHRNAQNSSPSYCSSYHGYTFYWTEYCHKLLGLLLQTATIKWSSKLSLTVICFFFSTSAWRGINACFISSATLMCGRNGIIKTKAGLPAKQAGSQWTDQQGRGNKGTEEAIFHSGQAAPLIFHMAMQIYSSQDLTQPLRTRGGGLTFHLSNFLLLRTTSWYPNFPCVVLNGLQCSQKLCMQV